MAIDETTKKTGSFGCISVFDFIKVQKRKKTRDIVFRSLKITNYLSQNSSTNLSKVIFSVRSKTLDIIVWNSWKYVDNICVGCNIQAETMCHFMTCISYTKETEESHWKTLLFENEIVKQFEIAQKIQKRMEMREDKINNEDGLASHTLAPVL